MATIEVQMGRVKKRLSKVEKQRDYYKKQLEHYQAVLASQPFLQTQYDSYTRRISVVKEYTTTLETLKERVEEQAKLIRVLDLEKFTS
jgi:prefoldin subunit 5